ncbi:cation:proton antiporter [Actinoplanes sp. NPDC023801]|uniref:cation:proton antiporter domain-containing protein n=1 Tax=Actinoplanes sp. NPDC023801 TaxID=3154595 RepID=UPI0033EABAF2
MLNVESGLNDGIVTPVVTIAIAGAAAAEAVQGAASLGGAVIDLAVGVATGTVAGLLGGHGMRIARRRGWASEDFAGPAVLALALASYTGTLWLGGNGFVAAFGAGLAFGHFAGRGGAKEVFYVEQTGVHRMVRSTTICRHAGWRPARACQCHATTLRATGKRIMPPGRADRVTCPPGRTYRSCSIGPYAGPRGGNVRRRRWTWPETFRWRARWCDGY